MKPDVTAMAVSNCEQLYSRCEAIGTFQLVGSSPGVPIPEPAPLILLAGGIAGLILLQGAPRNGPGVRLTQLAVGNSDG